MTIWWLSEMDIEAIGQLPAEFPLYIRRQFSSMQGRRKAGRLWVDIEFPEPVSAGVPIDTPLGRLICRHCGGIPLVSQDVHLVRQLPGILTDPACLRL